MGLFRSRPKTGNFLRDHSLGLFFSTLLALQLLFNLYLGFRTYPIEQPMGDGELWTANFWSWWLRELNLSMLADTFGVWVIVYASKWLFERNSAESNDNGGENNGNA